MTDAELTAIRERCRPGVCYECGAATLENSAMERCQRCDWQTREGAQILKPERAPRADIRALLAEVERLREAMQRLLIEERYQEALAAEREACAAHLERRAAEMDVDCELATVAFVLRAEAAIIRARSTL